MAKKMASEKMSETAITLVSHDQYEEFDDIEDFFESQPIKLPEDDDVWFPTEYVELVLGPRGSGKSTRVARKLILALKQGYNVFTNYELYPEKIGITNKPKPLDLEFLLSFDTSLSNAVIGIGEVDTWLERKRAMSTTSIAVDKFLHQLRKRGLRVFMDTQSPSLPSVVINQVDLMVWSHDSFYTSWGIEHRIQKGTSFYYNVQDYSGIFTGYPGRTWQEALTNADRIWPLYNTYQVFDPWQWARKVELVGEKMVFDIDEGKMYTGGEHNLEIEQREIRHFNTILQAEYRAWANDLIDVAIQNDAVLENRPNRWVLSIDRILKAMAKAKGKQKRILERGFERLQKLAEDSNGYLAKISRGRNIIELSKPLVEISND